MVSRRVLLVALMAATTTAFNLAPESAQASRRVLLVALMAATTTAFNLAPESAQVYAGPQINSYFGYTVALQRVTQDSDVTARLIVGAPKGNSSLPARRAIAEPGLAYQCSVTEDNCTPILLDVNGNGRNDEYHPLNDGAWIGGAMDVVDDAPGVMVCGPRWTQNLTNIKKDEFGNKEYDSYMQGICYWSLNSSVKANLKVPLENHREKGQYVVNGTLSEFYYFYGEAGFSVHLIEGGAEAIMGAPGVHNWTGSVVRYTKTAEGPGGSQRRRRATVKDTLDRHFIPNPYYTKQIQVTEYFGYAVDSGHFVDGKTYYVGGAPRAADLCGSVLVFDFPTKEDDPMIVHAELKGTQFGEYFGSALCVLDVNADGLDDLLVGAPLHSLRSAGTQLQGDEGRVYVFINQQGRLPQNATAVLTGNSVPAARFGTTVAKLGDINQDGFKDIAVGAPYEGAGVVYIYLGDRAGVRAQYSQRITAEAVSADVAISGFGISISRGLDIDDNMYNDVAVGASGSDHAVLLRARPVVTFQPALTSNVSAIDVNATDFTLIACLDYTSPHALSTVAAHVVLSMTSQSTAAHFGGGAGNYSYIAALDDGGHCTSVQVALSTTSAGRHDVTKPLEVQMTYRVDDQVQSGERDSNGFCKFCPVVDPSLPTTFSFQIHFNTGCKETVCRSDLAVLATLPDTYTSAPLTLGTVNKLPIKIAVKNTGEPAYRAKLTVTLSSMTPLLRRLPSCQEKVVDEKVTVVECELANPLRTDRQILLEFDLSRVTLTDPLVYSFNVTSDGEEVTAEDNFRTQTLHLAANSTVDINGASSQDQMVYSKTNHSTLTHSYEISNRGPSPVHTLDVEFRIPVAIRTPDGVVPILCLLRPEVNKGDITSFTCADVPGLFVSDASQCGDVDVRMSTTPGKRSNNRIASRVVADAELPANRTLFIDCSNNPDVQCVTVKCSGGPFFSGKDKAVIKFTMQAATDRLDKMMKKRDMIAISTSGLVIYAGGHGVSPGQARTVFYGSLPDEALASWIWILAIILAILILAVIVAVLYKTGFFKRQAREDLQNLKGNVDDDDYNLTQAPVGDDDALSDLQVLQEKDMDEAL